MAERVKDAMRKAEMAQTTGEIAEATDLSRQYTGKILSSLYIGNKIIYAQRSDSIPFSVDPSILPRGEHRLWTRRGEDELRMITRRVRDIRDKSLDLCISRIKYLDELKTKVESSKELTEKDKGNLLGHVERELSKKRERYKNIARFIPESKLK